MYLYTDIHAPILTCTYIYAHRHAYINIYTHIDMHICKHIYIHTYAFIYSYILKHADTYVHVHIHTYLYINAHLKEKYSKTPCKTLPIISKHSVFSRRQYLGERC